MAKTGDENPTPMRRRYWSIKETCGGAILMFRLGDFYEMFEEDAIGSTLPARKSLTPALWFDILFGWEDRN